MLPTAFGQEPTAFGQDFEMSNCCFSFRTFGLEKNASDNQKQNATYGLWTGTDGVWPGF